MADLFKSREALTRNRFVVLVQGNVQPALPHPFEKLFGVRHLFVIPVIARPDDLACGIRIEHQHIERNRLLPESIRYHLPLVGRIAGAGTEPCAQHIPGDHGDGADQLSQLAQHPLEVASIYEEVPVLTVFLGPGLNPLARRIPNGGHAVVEQIIAVAAERPCLVAGNSARRNISGHPSQVLVVLVAGLPGVLALFVLPAHLEVFRIERSRCEAVTNHHPARVDFQPAADFVALNQYRSPIALDHAYAWGVNKLFGG